MNKLKLKLLRKLNEFSIILPLVLIVDSQELLMSLHYSLFYTVHLLALLPEPLPCVCTTSQCIHS